MLAFCSGFRLRPCPLTAAGLTLWIASLAKSIFTLRWALASAQVE
jgi:hypothetical protein